MMGNVQSSNANPILNRPVVCLRFAMSFLLGMANAKASTIA
jgi:hypothetical protein